MPLAGPGVPQLGASRPPWSSRQSSRMNSLEYDYLVVGAGLTGATLARLIADQGKPVLVVDRRAHIGGNLFEKTHRSGIPVHAYGPHYFRTSSPRIWHFVNRFTAFRPFTAVLKSLIEERYENWPISAEYIERTVGFDWQPAFAGTPNNFQEASLSMMPREIYELFVKGYTEKQWGVNATELEPALAGRFDVRLNNDPRLKTSTYQGLPAIGYSAFMEKVLDGIPVTLTRRTSPAAQAATLFVKLNGNI